MSLSDPNREFIILLIQWTGFFSLVAGIGLILLGCLLPPQWDEKAITALWSWLLLGAAGLIYLQSPQGGVNVLMSYAVGINAGVWAFAGLLYEGV